MGHIYCITNIINGKRYIGKTTNTVEQRFKEHQRDSQKDNTQNRPLYNAFKKYGIENFIVEELEQVDNSMLSEREIYWIKEYNTFGDNGYNASKGGDGTILYDHNEIIELARLGYTPQQIHDKTGCSKDRVLRVLKANGVSHRNENARLIAQYDQAGNYIQTFFGALDAQEWLLKNQLTTSKRANTSVSKCCSGKMKTAFGYIWKYLPESE